MLPQLTVTNATFLDCSARRWMSLRTWATTAVFPVPIFP